MKPFWSTGNTVRQAVFSPDGFRLACVRQSDALVSDVQDLRKNRVIVPRQETEVTFVAWSQDSTAFALIQKDSSVVIVTTLRESGEDDERWIDLKAAGSAALCAWNANDWLATVSFSGKVLLSQASEPSKWSATTLPGAPSRIAASDTLWAFAIAKEGVWLCAAEDGALVRRISDASLDPARSLAFKGSESNLVLICDGKTASVLMPRSRKLTSLALTYIALAAVWSERGQDTCLVVARDSCRLLLVEAHVEEMTGANLSVTLLDEVLVSSTLPDTPLAGGVVFELNARSQTLSWGTSTREGFELHVTSFGWTTAERRLGVRADRTLMLKEGPATSCTVSSEGLHAALTLNETAHLVRLLTRPEQALDIVSQPFSFDEFVFYYLIPATALCLLLAGLYLGIYPWQVTEVVLDVFALTHFRL